MLSAPRRVMVLGASGTIGRETVAALVEAGHAVVCFVRPRAGYGGTLDEAASRALLAGATVRFGDATDRSALAHDGFGGERFDTLVTCLASRTGTPRDAWRIDHDAQLAAIDTARAAGVEHVVLLSALCVQKPKLPFQRAKRACEDALIASGLAYSIVRPTAFFKSLSGQFARVRSGRSFLMFGDGRGTACKPIGDIDLGRYLARCVTDDGLRNRVLPIGGPGPAITPRAQGELLFAATGRAPRFRSVPIGVLDAIIAVLATLGRVFAGLADKAELARIGRYYATESMLVLDPVSGRYDADVTPATGTQTLGDHYARLASGAARVERGDHSVF